MFENVEKKLNDIETNHTETVSEKMRLKEESNSGFKQKFEEQAHTGFEFVKQKATILHQLK